jgi:hypothetical protein
LFFIMLLSFEMVYGVIALVQINKVFDSTAVPDQIILVCSVLFLLFILFTCVALFKIKKHALTIVKTFLITRVIYLGLSSILVFIKTVNNKYAIGGRPDQFESIPMMVIMLLVTPLVYTLLFSISWYIYFCKAKRVKRTYGDTTQQQ